MEQRAIEWKTKFNKSTNAFVFWSFFHFSYGYTFKGRTLKQAYSFFLLMNFKLRPFERKKEFNNIISPLLLASLMEYFEGKSSTKTASLYGGLICFAQILCTISYGQQEFFQYRYSLQIRLSILGLVYKKVKSQYFT